MAGVYILSTEEGQDLETNDGSHENNPRKISKAWGNYRSQPIPAFISEHC
jgi:hypothetical protein